MATVIGFPVGIALHSRLPQFTSLKPRYTNLRVNTTGSKTVFQFDRGAQQLRWIWRALYSVYLDDGLQLSIWI